MTNAAYHKVALFPEARLPFPRQKVKNVSHKPAKIKITQFISIKSVFSIKRMQKYKIVFNYFFLTLPYGKTI